MKIFGIVLCTVIIILNAVEIALTLKEEKP